MNKEKLVVVIMGQDCEKFIGMCLESVKDADAIVYCDGGTYRGQIMFTDKCEEIGIGINKRDFIQNKYDQEYIGMNGRQRMFYLDYLKKNYPGWWCLALDADEVVSNDGIKKIKEFINFLPKENHDILYSIHMRHLIGDLIHEDTTVPIHFVPHRLFKIRDELIYQEVEHPVLGHPNWRSQHLYEPTIWHLAYCSSVWDIKKRYKNHMKKSQMHSPEWLNNWYKAFLFGEYPNKKFDPIELPDIILNEFEIDKDELYFHNRKEMLVNHYQDAIDWKDYFKCKSVLLFGCGFGQRVKALRHLNVSAFGIELSKYAVENGFGNTTQGSITDAMKNDDGNTNDLAVAYDVLEHLEYEDLEKAIDNLMNCSHKNILISVPYKGTEECDGDSTHIIKEDKDWWVEKFTSKGLKEVEVPEHFLYKAQLLIFEK